MSERKLQAWIGAGLIDADAASRIREWEAHNSRPLALWAIVGLAVLTIGLGLISLIAANWEAIPGTARLTIHFACISGLTLYLFLGKQHADHQALIHDGALFILGALGLTFFGHIGQVYQSSAPIWQALGFWLLLFSPVLLLFGRGWPVAGMWLAGFIATVDSFAMDKMEAASQYAPTFHLSLILSLPVAITGFAAFFRFRSTRLAFWRNLEMLSFLVTIIGTGGMLLVGSLSDLTGGGNDKVMDEARIAQALVAIVTALLVWLFHKGRSGHAIAGILTVAALLNIVAALTGSNVILGALIFILFGVSIAVASLYAEWRGAFQGAVVVIALRLIILSFQLADDLLGSGVGLILAGFLTLGIAYAAVRISRNYAPDKETAA
jgi:Predicted membrane protein (DUF2157)